MRCAFEVAKVGRWENRYWKGNVEINTGGGRGCVEGVQWPGSPCEGTHSQEGLDGAVGP